MEYQKRYKHKQQNETKIMAPFESVFVRRSSSQFLVKLCVWSVNLQTSLGRQDGMQYLFVVDDILTHILRSGREQRRK